jgi:hypothetical protein
VRMLQPVSKDGAFRPVPCGTGRSYVMLQRVGTVSLILTHTQLSLNPGIHSTTYVPDLLIRQQALSLSSALGPE